MADILFSVFEIRDDVGKRSAFGAPDNWEVDGRLKWPKTRNMNLHRKNKVSPDDDWEWTADYKVLARNLPSLRACLAKERKLEYHSDSESVEKAKKVKALKRLHPVNLNSKSSQYDLSSEFEAVTAKKPKGAHKLNLDAPGLNSLNASESTAHAQLVQSDSSSATMISDGNEMDIANIPIILDESTGECIPLTVEDETENEAVESQLVESSDVGNIMVIMKEALQAMSDSICCRMDSFEKTIDRLDKKVDGLAIKQEALALKLDSSEQKIDSELKLIAGVHVKLDTLPTPNTLDKKKRAPSVNIPLPIPSTSQDDVQKILLTIKNDVNIADDLETQLVSFGGDTPRRCTYAILRHLFADEVCMKYTWQGTHDKGPFEKLTQINELIKKCVRVHFTNYTDDQYKKDVQEHLKHALTREGRKYF